MFLTVDFSALLRPEFSFFLSNLHILFLIPHPFQWGGIRRLHALSPFRNLFAVAVPAAVLCAVDSISAAIAVEFCPPSTASVYAPFLWNLLRGCGRRGSNFRPLFRHLSSFSITIWDFVGLVS